MSSQAYDERNPPPMEEDEFFPLVDIEDIDLDGSPKARDPPLNEATVESYRELLRDGVELPPVDLFYDADAFWVGDGRHRIEAAARDGRTGVRAKLHTGSRDECVRFALKANAEHGLPRTNADKRRVVKTALEHAFSRGWSERRIAMECRVSNHLVATVLESLDQRNAVQPADASGNSPRYEQPVENTQPAPRPEPERITVKRGDQEYQMTRPGPAARKVEAESVAEAEPEPGWRKKIGYQFRRMKEVAAKRGNPVVSERRKSHVEGVMDAATYAERRSAIEHWIDDLATHDDLDWLVEKVAALQAEKYGLGDRGEEEERA
jgi:hypothetical protein